MNGVYPKIQMGPRDASPKVQEETEGCLYEFDRTRCVNIR